jgi:hypothetical protein
VCRVSFSLRFALGLKFGYLYSDAKIIKNDKIQNKMQEKIEESVMFLFLLMIIWGSLNEKGGSLIVRYSGLNVGLLAASK